MARLVGIELDLEPRKEGKHAIVVVFRNSLPNIDCGLLLGVLADWGEGEWLGGSGSRPPIRLRSN